MNIKVFVTATIIIFVISKFIANYKWDEALWASLALGLFLSVRNKNK